MQRIHFVKWVIYIIAFIIIFIFQFTILPQIFKEGPLILIPAVICLAMFEGRSAGWIFGLVAGMLWDSQNARLFGFNCIFLMLFGLTVGLLIQYLFRNTIVSVLLFTAFSTVILEFLKWYFFINLYGDNQIVYAFLQVILPTTIYTLIFTIPIYIGFKKLNKILEIDSNS